MTTRLNRLLLGVGSRELLLALACLANFVSACGSSTDDTTNHEGGATGVSGGPGSNASGAPTAMAGAVGAGAASVEAGAGSSAGSAAGASGAFGGASGSAGNPTGGSAGTGSGNGGSAGVGGPALAFPGAFGVAARATGGRGGSVYHVTTLADSGPGSFRDAVSQPKRIIVFDVGGYIVLKSPISTKGDLTIAGQTAPGDGIGIMAGEVSFSGAKNVIARYVRFRQGDLDPDSKKSGINLLNTDTMIFDHVSIEFAQWNNIDAVGAKNVTVQYSVDANPIGQQFAAHTENGPYTWYRNLFANSHNRCPLAKANTQYVGNVVYDYQAGYTAGNSSGTFSHDLIDNYFIAGPSTTSAGNALFQVNTQLMFASGNLIDSNRDGTLNGSALSLPGAATKLSSAFSPDTHLLASTGAGDAYNVVLDKAGASLHRDEVDTLVVADVKSLGKAGHMWQHQTDTGLGNSGYGTLKGGTAATDGDADGMPDTWETKYGLDPKNPSDASGDFDHTGYTNVEKFVNGLADGSYP